MTQFQGGKLPILRLGGLTAAALAIHGYHLGVEDAEIYVPAAKKLLQSVRPGKYTGQGADCRRQSRLS